MNNGDIGLNWALSRVFLNEAPVLFSIGKRLRISDWGFRIGDLQRHRIMGKRHKAQGTRRKA